MPHHAIGLFLEVAASQIPLDDFEAPSRGKLADGEPPIFYWRHLDTGGTAASQKRVLRGLDTFGDTDSGREDTSVSDETELVDEESTSVEVGGEVAGSGPSFFTPPQLSTLAHLTTSMSIIPPFGQRHAPIVMTPPTVAEVVPRAVTEMVPRMATEAVP